MYKLTKDPVLLSFNFKLLHRNIITNKNLSLWHVNTNLDKCTFCNMNSETIEHMFYYCNIIQRLWADIFNWIFIKTGLRINFTIKHYVEGRAIDGG